MYVSARYLQGMTMLMEGHSSHQSRVSHLHHLIGSPKHESTFGLVLDLTLMSAIKQHAMATPRVTHTRQLMRVHMDTTTDESAR